MNRGQSGDGIQELLCRWRKDGILLRPTILNLLIGINDSSAFHSYGADGSGMPAERYEEILQMLLTDAYKELPGLETVLCEPFYLPYGEIGEREKRIKREVSGYAGVVKRLAEEFGCVFLPLQEELVGPVRVLDDSELVAYMHYVLVRPDHQGQGIAGEMIRRVKEKYKNYLSIEIMPKESKNAAFYERFGFQKMEDGVAMQLCYFADRR